MEQLSYRQGLLFSRAHQAVRERIYDILSLYDLTPSHWSVLSAPLSAGEGVQVTSLAEEMGVKTPFATMLANELTERGLMKRLPHGTDGRAKLVVLTPKGKKLVEKLEVELDQEIKKLMDGVSETDAKSFQATLQKILDNSRKKA